MASICYHAVACVARRQAAVRVVVGGGLLALRPTANRGLLVAAADELEEAGCWGAAAGAREWAHESSSIT